MNSESKESKEIKLTAYALGEMDETEAAQFKTSLEGEDLQQIEDVQHMAALLSDELSKEPMPDTPSLHLPKRRTFTALRGLALAACLTLAALGAFVIYQQIQPPVTTASKSLRLAKVETKELQADIPNGKYKEISEIDKKEPQPVGDVARKSIAASPGGTGSKPHPSKPLTQRQLVELAKQILPPSGGRIIVIDRSHNISAGGGSLEFGAGIGIVGSKNVPAGRGGAGGSRGKNVDTISGDIKMPWMYDGPRVASLEFRGEQGKPGQVEIDGKMVTGWVSSDKQDQLARNNPNFNTEAYDHITDNPFRAVADHPLSTFSIDVDTASYANVRRFINQGQLPPKGAVRIEELINYFDYQYSAPGSGKLPFAAHVEIASAPWQPEHRLVKVGLKGKVIEAHQRPASNLVFLIDVSGSMQPANKLPLLREAFKLLVHKLDERDRIAIVVYAGASGMVLDSTSVHDKQPILAAIDRLKSGGSTNGTAGIELAYQIAEKNKLKGTNRVILATDGDFNVGVTNQSQLVELIEKKAKSGVFLSVLGFGRGNLKDSTMEKLADKGNGNYAYIDTMREAKKVLVQQMTGTLITIAKDVKIQIEFNPAKMQSYRLIGYDNRMLRKEDFNDDTKDAGDIGAGHTVTALYEVVLAGTVAGKPAVDALKYQNTVKLTDAAKNDELLTLKLRYKAPQGDKSKLLEFPVTDQNRSLADATDDFRFAAAVAGFGMILRQSPHKGAATFENVLDLAQGALGEDQHGYRSEFVQIVEKARRLNRLRQN